ncbi:hypothetical protein BsWGS_22070 [Bradybaena similaris]
MEHVCRFLLLVSIIYCVSSYPHFRTLIPNGLSVPNPCKPGQTWNGVGHFRTYGFGHRNPFGLDFFDAGRTWTVELCRKDSDGDGVSNGVELGDPNCIWQVGDTPTHTDRLSHPGVRSVAMRLPANSSIPARETTYACIVLDLASLGIPQDQDFHLVAITPMLDNKNYIHHIGVIGCIDEMKISPNVFECEFVVSPRCPDRIHFWSMGLGGECYHPSAGIRIGKTGIKKLALQVHWNNPQHVQGLVDSSGLMLYYTPHLRPYDAGVLMTGTSVFSLPPRQPALHVEGKCSSQCTRRGMLGPINIASSWNHMHYAGIKMNIEVTRDRHPVANLTDDRAYDFFNPIIYQHSPAFVLQPGDELHARCTFNTLDRNKTTVGGLGARDEMCMGFINYFPRQNMKVCTCLDNYGVSLCSNDSWGECKDLPRFVEKIEATNVFRDVLENCKSFFPCQVECVQTIVQYMTSEPCLQGRVWEYVQNMLSSDADGHVFLSRLASCKVEVFLALNSTRRPDLY